MRLLQKLGLLGTIRYVMARWTARCDSGRKRLSAKTLNEPLWVRPGTSDVDVFGQITVGDEYECLSRLKAPYVIVDCGANIGVSAAWFLSRFPSTIVISVEPDPDNFALLDQNMRPYGSRWRGIQSALWSVDNLMLEVHREFRDGREWARAVRQPATQSERVAPSITIGAILDQLPDRHIGLLKIDIEGAERDVFRTGFDDWLPSVDRILIELHDEECERVFHAAVPDTEWQKLRSGELIYCERKHAI